MIPEILYEDAQLYVVYKPVGMESQSGRSFAMDLCSYLKNRQAAEGVKQPFVGVVHRLDRNVAGVMVYAKTRQAAAELSRQVAQGTVEKYYQALLCHPVEPEEGTLVHTLLQDKQKNVSKVVPLGTVGAKEAKLTYRTVKAQTLTGLYRQLPPAVRKQAEDGRLTGVEIHLLTGRHHQIRVQFSASGSPLWGDGKYNPAFIGKRTPCVALCAFHLIFTHPTTGQQMDFRI